MGELGLLLNTSWLVTCIGIIALFFVPVRVKPNLAIFMVIINAVITSYLSIQALTGIAVENVLFAGYFFKDLVIRIDSLSAWFILIINFTCVTGAFYGSGYLKAYDNPAKKLTMHWIIFVLFQLSMIWVCMLQHAVVFLIAWEIMSLTSMMLVIFDHHNPQTIKAGINYLIQMHISVAFLTIGFIWLYFQTGSFSFDAFNAYFGTNSNIWLFLVFFIGFGLKAGFIPLHSWLPHAHPAGPSHVSGVMSGVIVKLGIYGIIRMASYLQTDHLLLGEIIVSISILTGLYGILNASVHRDFKKMLAYCTIENIGIIGIGIGIGLMGIGNSIPILYYLGFGGALLHVLNHSLFKSLLFYSVGSVYQQTHTRNMEKLGGLIKRMPRTAFTFLIGAIAIGGMPPLNGFISEFLIYNGLLEGLKFNALHETILMILTLAGLSVIGGLSILTFTKNFGTIFLGSERQKLAHEPHEVSSLMLVPQYFVIAAMICVAAVPQVFLQAIGKVLTGLCNSQVLPEPIEFTNYASIMQSISLYSFVFMAVVLLFWGLRFFALRGRTQVINATWGCGYVNPTSKLQYTGKSFSKSLSKIFNFIVIEKKQYNELKPGEIFPSKRAYISHYHDFFESRLIHSITNRLIYSANYFKFIQNGRVQFYVLYGIAFILTIFILTALNIL